MKRATYALSLGVLFVLTGLTSAQADYGYGHRPSYHGHYHPPVKHVHVYTYRPVYRPVVVVPHHCDHHAPVYRYSRGHY